VDKDRKKIALSIKRAEVDPWTTVEQRYAPGQIVTGVVTKIAPFGAFARIEDGIEGLIHLSELMPGMDPKQALHEGTPLQLRILRIDAEHRRLGLSLRQANDPEAKEIPVEMTEVEALALAQAQAAEKAMPSLEEVGTPRADVASSQPEGHTPKRADGKGGRAPENPLLSNLPPEGSNETTAMAEAFRAAARQRSKDEPEKTEP